MEQVLQLINTKYVSLDEEEVRHSNELLKSKIKDILIPKMQENILFKEIYNTLSYGGSYYDRLKVGKPDEFDLDIKLFIPQCKEHKKKKCKRCVEIISCEDAPGFIYFKVKETHNKDFNKFLEDSFMQNNRVIKRWFKSIVTVALGDIEDEFKKEAELEDVEIIEKEHQDKEEQTGKVKLGSESGPALTLRVQGKFGQIDIDLVPAFEFDIDNWPVGFRRNTSQEKNSFLVVPKKLDNDSEYCERYWRGSFQEQESELIHGKQWLKPALKLVKKMRTSHHTSIPSYALKTITLWDVELELFDYNGGSLSDSFLHIAKTYRSCLAVSRIFYYWKEDNNLFDMKCIHSDTLKNYHNHISKILDELDAEPANPYIIAKLILKDGTEEYEEIISEMKEKDEIYNINHYTSYSNIDPSLQLILTKILNPEMDRLRIIKSFVRNHFLPSMKSKDPVFKKMCPQKMFFYYNYFIGLGHSLCLGLSTPKCETCNKKNCSCVTLSQGEKFLFMKVKRNFCESWNRFTHKEYLQGDLVLKWLYGLVKDTLKTLTLPDDIQSCEVEYIDEETSNSRPVPNNGPRLTLIVGGHFDVLHINIVPAFIMTYDSLPQNLYFDSTEKNIYIVPAQNGSYENRHWWPCFYDQEKELLKNKGCLKPVLRLLRKVRDSQGHRLVSDYALRSMFFWDVKNYNFNYNKSLGDTFMYMIAKYAEHLKTQKIQWYWKVGKFNILNSESTKLEEYYQDIKNKITQFKNDCSEHPEFVAKFILGNETYEYNAFKRVEIESFQQAMSEYRFFEDQDSDSDDDQDSDSDDDQDSDSEDDDLNPSSSQDGFGGGSGGGSSSFTRQFTGYRNDYSNDSTEDIVKSRNQHLLDRRPVDDSANGWLIAAGVLGTAAVVGLGIAAFANRNNNNRKK